MNEKSSDYVENVVLNNGTLFECSGYGKTIYAYFHKLIYGKL